MAKSAADIATELSDKESKNKKVDVEADVEDEKAGGLSEENPIVTIFDDNDPNPKTGTPYDLVEGRPNIDFFGPLPGYQFVTTGFGEYGLPQGQILRFEQVEKYDKKEGIMKIHNQPVYEDAPQKLLDYVLGTDESDS